MPLDRDDLRLGRFRSSLWCWALCAAALALSAYRLTNQAVNWDVGAFLLEARALAEGRELYSDLREFNLPANLWLPWLSLTLSRLLPFTLADIHQTVLFGLISFASLVAGRLIRSVVPEGSATALVAPGYFVLVCLYLPHWDFGQREPLFAALALPLIVALWARLNGVNPSLPTGLTTSLLAAFGAAQKPHFMVALLVVGLVYWVLVRRIRAIAPELWAVACLLGVYVIWIALRYPSYFPEILPNVAITYGSMGLPIFYVARRLVALQAAGFAGAASILLIIIDLRLREGGQHLKMSAIFGWAALLFVGAALFLTQRQALPYHRLVLEITATAVLGLAACHFIDLLASGIRVRNDHVRQRLLALSPLLVMAIPLLPYAPTGGAPPTRMEALGDPITTLLKSVPGSVVLALQTGTPPFTPLQAYADIRWNAGIITLFEMAPILTQRRQSGAEITTRDRVLHDQETSMREAVLDAVRRRPALIFVDVSQPLRWFERFPGDARILDFLKEDPQFAQAWDEFERVAVFDSIFKIKVEVYRPRRGAFSEKLPRQ